MTSFFSRFRQSESFSFESSTRKRAEADVVVVALLLVAVAADGRGSGFEPEVEAPEAVEDGVGARSEAPLSVDAIRSFVRYFPLLEGTSTESLLLLFPDPRRRSAPRVLRVLSTVTTSYRISSSSTTKK